MYDITVIMPAHNEGKYIRESIESIIGQTFGFNRLQLILADDASTDDTLKIMKEYESKYSNIKVITFEEKTGSAGKPRNEAIKCADGKYLMFIDADDLYELDACEKMYNCIEEKHTDFVTANSIDMNEEKQKYEKPFIDLEKYPSQYIEISSIKDDVLPMTCSACFKIFSTEFVKRNNLKFLEGCPAEDSYFSYSSLIAAKKCYYNSDIIYNYRRRYSEGNLSISTNFSFEYFEKINYAYNKIYEKFRENGFIKYYRAYYLNSVMYVLFNLIDSNKISNDEKIDVLKMIRWLIKLCEELNIKIKEVEDNSGVIALMNFVINEDYQKAIDLLDEISRKRSCMTKEEDDEQKSQLKKRIKESF